MSIGSLTNDAAISVGPGAPSRVRRPGAADTAGLQNILVQDVEAYQCTNMLMLKSYPNGASAFSFTLNTLALNAHNLHRLLRSTGLRQECYVPQLHGI